MDAKVKLDTSALFRHKDLADLRDWSQEDPRDVAASKADLNYIGLEGSIGCLGIIYVKLRNQLLIFTTLNRFCLIIIK